MKSERRAFNGLALFAALIMPFNVIGYPITFSSVVSLITVYTYLYSVWSGFRALERKSESFEAMLPSDQQPKFLLIRKQASITCIAAIGGMATAYAVGNRASAHWPHWGHF